MMNGAAGHTYGANGIWQVNRKGQPHGPSPTVGSPPTGYGTIAWDEAMHLPGSQQVGLGKKLLQQYPWHDFKPHPEWAAFDRELSLSFAGCQWIWYPDGDPAQNAPAEKRFFRRTFVLPADRASQSARLRVSADDSFTARLNGQALGGGDNWQTGQQFNDLARLLKAGTNVLAIEAENSPANGANPAGLIACLEIQFADGGALKLVSDATWRSSKSEVAGWDRAIFEDETWAKATAIGGYGAAPWGQIDGSNNDEVFGPQCAGIAGVVRVIYVPESEPIVVRNLSAGAAYAATYFDPVSGAKTTPAPVRVGAAGLWTCPPPIGHNHDWVLILESKKERRK